MAALAFGRRLAVGAALALFALALAGCGHGVAAGYQALANVAKSSDAALKGFEAFDRDYQQAIVAEEKYAGRGTEDILGRLHAYRQKRNVAAKAFADVGAAITTGHALLPLVEAGAKKQTDLNAWLQELFAAASEVQAALKLLGPPPPPSANAPQGGVR